MAHSLSAKKRVRQNSRRNIINRSRKSQIKTQIKHFEAALNSGRYMEARRQHGVVLKNLKGTRMFLEGQVSLDQVRSPTLPAHLQEEMIDTADCSGKE